MRIDDIHKVGNLGKERAELLDQMELIQGEGLGLTIRGRYQDDEFLDSVRPSAVLEMQRRIRLVEEELSRLGVTF